MTPHRWWLLLCLIVAAGCGVPRPDTIGDGGPPPGAIANLWQRCAPDTTGCDVWLMSPDGSGARNLTPNTETSMDFDVQWSADHSRIVFSSTRSGNPDIFIMNADGSGPTALTKDPQFESFASFSPDGKRLVFSRAAPVTLPGGGMTGKLQLHTMNVDGSDVKRVSATAGTEEEAAFSPDGTRLLFDSDATGTFQLYLMNVDGTGLQALTNETTENRYPSWSPDGKKIVFGSQRTGNPELFLMNADGSNVVQVTTSPGAINSDPAWSSDGKTIVFASTRDGNAEIYTMNADGSDQRRVTNDATFDAGPFAW